MIIMEAKTHKHFAFTITIKPWLFKDFCDETSILLLRQIIKVVLCVFSKLSSLDCYG